MATWPLERLNAERSAQADLNIHACGEVQLHQCVNGLVRWHHDVHKTLVGTNFVLVTRVLIDVRGNEDGVALDLGRQRDRPGDRRVARPKHRRSMREYGATFLPLAAYRADGTHVDRARPRTLDLDILFWWSELLGSRDSLFIAAADQPVVVDASPISS